jgi:hypothetical protein
MTCSSRRTNVLGQQLRSANSLWLPQLKQRQSPPAAICRASGRRDSKGHSVRAVSARSRTIGLPFLRVTVAPRVRSKSTDLRSRQGLSARRLTMPTNALSAETRRCPSDGMDREFAQMFVKAKGRLTGAPTGLRRDRRSVDERGRCDGDQLFGVTSRSFRTSYLSERA